MANGTDQYNPIQPIPSLLQQYATPGVNPADPIPSAGGIQWQQQRQQGLKRERLDELTQQQAGQNPIEQTAANLQQQREQNAHDLMMQRESQAHEQQMAQGQQTHEQNQAMLTAQNENLGRMQEEENRLTKQQFQPWNQMSPGKKIATTAERIGGIMFPGWVSRIPGSPMNIAARREALEGEIQKERQTGAEEMSAQARMIEAQTGKHGQPIQMRAPDNSGRIILGHLDPNDPTKLVPFQTDEGQFIDAGIPRQWAPETGVVSATGHEVFYEPSTAQEREGGVAVSPIKGPQEQQKEREIQDYISDPSNAGHLFPAGITPQNASPTQLAHARDLANQAIARFAPGQFIPLIGGPGQPSVLYNPLHGYEQPLPPGYQSTQEQGVADRSYQQNFQQLQKIRAPIDAIANRISNLQATLAQQGPQADALVAPELLSIMAGGPGSGLRMNEAEIARIVGGRSRWESLKASMNQWQLDPSKARSITADQDRQIRQLVSAVQGKLQMKMGVLQRANDALITAADPTQHRQILADTQKTLEQVDNDRYLTEAQINQMVQRTGKSRDEVAGSAQRQGYAILP